jgi:hypothetical protein
MTWWNVSPDRQLSLRSSSSPGRPCTSTYFLHQSNIYLKGLSHELDWPLFWPGRPCTSTYFLHPGNISLEGLYHELDWPLFWPGCFDQSPNKSHDWLSIFSNSAEQKEARKINQILYD